MKIMQNIENLQLSLIKKAVEYIKKLESKDIDVGLSSICNLQPHSMCPGYIKLKKLRNIFSIKNIYYQLKFFFSVIKFSDYESIGNISSNDRDKKTVIVSWAMKDNFSSTGEYNDSYFKISSKNKNLLWFLIYLEDNLPDKFDENIIILYKKKRKISSNFINIIKYIFITLKKNKLNPLAVYHQFAFQTYFAYLVEKYFKKTFVNTNINKIIFPYESMPFQNAIIRFAKKNYKNLITIGYNHSISPIPLYNLYKSPSPDLLYVPSEAQKFFLHNHFNWPENKIIYIASPTVSKRQDYFFNKKIFLPYDINDPKKTIKNLEKFFMLHIKDNIKPLQIRKHPHISMLDKVSFKRYVAFFTEAQKIIKKYQHKFSEDSKKELSIFIGGTSAIIEALENGVEVIQIAEDPIFDCYSNVLWPSINLEPLTDNIFKYSLKEKGKCLRFNNNKNPFNQIVSADLI